MKDYKIKLRNQTLRLHPERAAYWEEQSVLLVADLHLGKAGHFRKAGIPIPGNVHQDDLKRLKNLIHHYQPDKLLLLGDLFHSDHNDEWNDFLWFARSLQGLSIGLVTGNHDIMDKHQYSGLQKFDDVLVQAPFLFTHKPLETGDRRQRSPAQSDKQGQTSANSDHVHEPALPYNICGHVHPAIRVSVGLKHRVRTYCFHFGKNQATLPAFGLFTGAQVIKPGPEDLVYAIVEGQIIQVKT